MDESTSDYRSFNENDRDSILVRPFLQAPKKFKVRELVIFSRKRFNCKVCSFLCFLTAWIAIFIVSWPDVENNIVYSIASYGEWSTRPFKIILFGDSLINVPCKFYNLAEKLQHQFPNFAFTIINAGVNNDRIADMKDRMYNDVVSLNPDAVMIFWDSDVSDQLVDILSEQSTQQQFEANCVSVFTTCKNASKFISVSGPSILSEGPIFPTDEYDAYSYKFDTLNQYRSIVKNVSTTFHIPYIDMRGSFMSAIPSSWHLAR